MLLWLHPHLPQHQAFAGQHRWKMFGNDSFDQTPFFFCLRTCSNFCLKDPKGELWVEKLGQSGTSFEPTRWVFFTQALSLSGSQHFWFQRIAGPCLRRSCGRSGGGDPANRWTRFFLSTRTECHCVKTVKIVKMFSSR